jgi:hypothetical protein
MFVWMNKHSAIIHCIQAQQNWVILIPKLSTVFIAIIIVMLMR